MSKIVCMVERRKWEDGTGGWESEKDGGQRLEGLFSEGLYTEFEKGRGVERGGMWEGEGCEKGRDIRRGG